MSGRKDVIDRTARRRFFLNTYPNAVMRNMLSTAGFAGIDVRTRAGFVQIFCAVK